MSRADLVDRLLFVEAMIGFPKGENLKYAG